MPAHPRLTPWRLLVWLCSSSCGIAVFDPTPTSSSHATSTSSSSGATSGGDAGGAGGAPACPDAWTHVFGGPGLQLAGETAIGAKGEVAVHVAFYDEGVALDGRPWLDATDGNTAVITFDPFGAPLATTTWRHSIFSSTRLTPLVDGGFAFAELTSDPASFGDGQGWAAPAGRTLGVVRLGPNGHVRWARSVADMEDDVAQQSVLALADDGAGNLLVSGPLPGGRPGAFGLVGRSFFAKLDAQGDVVWTRGFEVAAPSGIVGTGDGTSFVCGTLSEPVDFGNGVLVPEGDGDLFLVQLDALGSSSRSMRFGGPNHQYATACGAAPDGTVAVAGSFEGALVFDGVVLAQASGRGAFVARFDRWDEVPHVSSWDASNAPSDGFTLVMAVASGMRLGAPTASDVDVGCGRVSVAPGAWSGFSARIDPQGSCFEQKVVGSPTYGVGSMSFNRAGSAVFAGQMSRTTATETDAFVAVRPECPSPR